MSLWADFEELERQRAQRRQMEHAWRQQQPGYPGYASGAIDDLATVDTLSATGLPVVADAADTALATDAAMGGRWGDAALYGAAAALPFVAGPALKAGVDAIGRRMGPVGDVPYRPNALMELEAARSSPAGGQAQMMLGEEAKNADLEALDRAREMARQGYPADEIWRATAPADPNDPRTGWWVPTKEGPSPPNAIPRFEMAEPEDLPQRLTLEPNREQITQLQGVAARLGAAERLRKRADAENLMPAEVAEPGTPQEVIDLAQANTPQALDAQFRKVRSQLNQVATQKPPMREVMDWPELYGARPDLGEVPVEVSDLGPKVYGAYHDPTQPGGEKIQLNRQHSNENLESLLHELNHAQEYRAGWPRGGSPESAPYRSRQAIDSINSMHIDLRQQVKRSQTVARGYANAAKLAQGDQAGMSPVELMQARHLLQQHSPEEVQAKLPELGADLDARVQELERFEAANGPTLEAMTRVNAMRPYDQYQRLAGEAQARAVERRARQPIVYRRDTPVWEDYDVPLEELIP
jgi:hypothetical protein